MGYDEEIAHGLGQVYEILRWTHCEKPMCVLFKGMVLSAILLCCTSGSGEQDDYEEHRLLRVEIGSTVYFFDAFTRQYEGFEHFLDTSFLPKCYICHPSHGKYTLQPDSEQVDILMVKSNACGILRQLWKMM